MALGFVQGTFGNGSSSTTTVAKAFAGNVTAGNLLWAVALFPTSVGGTATFTDNAGNTWPADTLLTTSGSSFAVSRVIAGTTGPCTITVTFQFAQSFPQLHIGEFNVGGHAAATDGTAATATDAADSLQSASITTTNNPDILICFFAQNNSGSLTALTSGWTQNVFDSGGGIGYASAVVTTAGAYSLAATETGAGGDDNVIYAYKANASGHPAPGTFSVTGSCPGRQKERSAAPGTFSETSAAASHQVEHSAAPGTFSETSAAFARVAIEGKSVGAFAVTGSCPGRQTEESHAIGTFSETGSANPHVTGESSARGTFSETSSALSRVAVEGKATGTVSETGSSFARIINPGGLSNYLKGKLADMCFGGAAFTPVSTLYLCAYTVSPGPNDTGTEVLAANGYVRIAVPNNLTAGFQTFLNPAKYMAAQLFSQATGPWGTVVSIGLRDSASGGNLYAYSDLVTPFNINAGVKLYFSATDEGLGFY